MQLTALVGDIGYATASPNESCWGRSQSTPTVAARHEPSLTAAARQERARGDLVLIVRPPDNPTLNKTFIDTERGLSEAYAALRGGTVGPLCPEFS